MDRRVARTQIRLITDYTLPCSPCATQLFAVFLSNSSREPSRTLVFAFLRDQVTQIVTRLRSLLAQSLVMRFALTDAQLGPGLSRTFSNWLAYRR